MKKRLVKFDDITWDTSNVGVAQKVYIQGNEKLRLIKFKEDFIEKDWCLKKHQGYVLDGEMKIDFNGEVLSYKKGDGIWIGEGEEFKHKVMIEKGKEVTLILFETVE